MTISLDRRRYRLGVYYSFRQEGWYMDILTDTGTDILIGITLVPEWPLIGRFADARLPAGEFKVIDTLEEDGSPGRDDFGASRRFQLVYIEANG